MFGGDWTFPVKMVLMSTYRFMIRKWLFSGVYLITFLSANVAVTMGQSGTARQPNIVIIMADDLDSRQLSCYGGENIQTTYIDRLASSGMRFNNMIASEAMCIPTRASLFTG